MTGSRRAFLLLLTLVIASGFVDFRIRQYPSHPFETYIPGVIDGTYGAPGIYRVLVPYSNTWLAEWTGWPPSSVWHISRLGWFLVAYLAFFRYLRTWFTVEASLAGVAAVAATLPLTYTNSWAHPDSIPELALFTLGCLAIVRGSDVGLAVVLPLALLNRETAAFLVLTYVVAVPANRRRLVRAAGFTAIAAGVLLSLRAWRGVEHYDYWQLGRNLAFLGLLPANYDLYKRAYAWFIVALTAPALAVIAAGWPYVPAIARRLLASAVPLVVTAVTLSSLIETRIFLPIYPLVMPALMWAVLQPRRSNEESSFAN